MAARHWLLKSDPAAFGWADLKRSPGRRTVWDGVRNYQARNFLRDDVRVGDGVLFYHSQSDKAILGACEVTKTAFADPTQFDRKHAEYDAGADRADPRWYAIEITLRTEFARPVTLDALRAVPALAKMALLQKGSRLSVQPVTRDEWETVLRMGRAK